jgi:hypothetical protein
MAMKPAFGEPDFWKLFFLSKDQVENNHKNDQTHTKSDQNSRGNQISGVHKNQERCLLEPFPDLKFKIVF